MLRPTVEEPFPRYKQGDNTYHIVHLIAKARTDLIPDQYKASTKTKAKTEKK